MASTKVFVIRETGESVASHEYQLTLQWCQYRFATGNRQCGYRFIWRTPVNDRGRRCLQAARGQARIPSMDVMRLLVNTAIAEGWGNLDDATYVVPEPPPTVRGGRARRRGNTEIA